MSHLISGWWSAVQSELQELEVPLAPARHLFDRGEVAVVVEPEIGLTMLRSVLTSLAPAAGFYEFEGESENPIAVNVYLVGRQPLLLRCEQLPTAEEMEQHDEDGRAATERAERALLGLVERLANELLCEPDYVYRWIFEQAAELLDADDQAAWQEFHRIALDMRKDLEAMIQRQHNDFILAQASGLAAEMLTEFEPGAVYSIEFLKARARDFLQARGHTCATLVNVEPVGAAARKLQSSKKFGGSRDATLPGL